MQSKYDTCFSATYMSIAFVICASKFSLVKQAIWPMAQLRRSGMSRGNWDKLISTQMNCCLSCASFAGLACLLVHNAMQICRGSKFFRKVNCEARDFHCSVLTPFMLYIETFC